MSFIEMPGMEDVKEAVPVPEGLYDLCITDATLVNKDGKNSIRVILEIEGQDDASNIFHHVGLPNEDDDAEKKKTKMLFAKRFFGQFKIKIDGGVEMESLVGSRASACKVVQDEWEGTMRNNLQCDPIPTEA